MRKIIDIFLVMMIVALFSVFCYRNASANAVQGRLVMGNPRVMMIRSRPTTAQDSIRPEAVRNAVVVKPGPWKPLSVKPGPWKPLSVKPGPWKPLSVKPGPWKPLA